eukprot:scpid74093/ scgid11064/ 
MICTSGPLLQMEKHYCRKQNSLSTSTRKSQVHTSLANKQMISTLRRLVVVSHSYRLAWSAVGGPNPYTFTVFHTDCHLNVCWRTGKEYEVGCMHVHVSTERRIIFLRYNAEGTLDFGDRKSMG